MSPCLLPTTSPCRNVPISIPHFLSAIVGTCISLNTRPGIDSQRTSLASDRISTFHIEATHLAFRGWRILYLIYEDAAAWIMSYPMNLAYARDLRGKLYDELADLKLLSMKQ
jgi:hypothetical protein